MDKDTECSEDKLEDIKKDDPKKSSWKGVFEDVVYSGGPGDNIFIYG